MNTTTSPRIAELSATLAPINTFPHIALITGPMSEEGEDSNSYNASFYCDGWIKPCFKGDFRSVLLQSVEEYQVIRFYFICTRLEGLAYDEIPEDWEDADIEIPQMELLDVIEYKQVWYNGSSTETLYLRDINDYYHSESYVVRFHSMQPWAFEPKHKNFLTELVNEYSDFDDEGKTLPFITSPCGELLAKNAPAILKYIIHEEQYSDAYALYRAFRIAIRHHYPLPTDDALIRTYIDYLFMTIAEDYHRLTDVNFICPADFVQAHDALATKRDALTQAREKLEAQAKEEEFAENHSYLFGIEFEDDYFHYKSLDSVEEYRREGEIMHHCIYRCGHYKHHYELALHITDLEGNRVATASIDVDKRKILQIQPISNDTGFFKEFGYKWQDTNDYKRTYNTLTARLHTFPRRKNNNIINLKKAS